MEIVGNQFVIPNGMTPCAKKFPTKTDHLLKTFWHRKITLGKPKRSNCKFGDPVQCEPSGAKSAHWYWVLVWRNSKNPMRKGERKKMAAKRMTLHSGRYNASPKHNDRTFDLEKADHSATLQTNACITGWCRETEKWQRFYLNEISWIRSTDGLFLEKHARYDRCRDSEAF